MTPAPALWLRLFLPFAGGYFLSYLFRTVNAVAGPVLSQELSLGAADLGLLTSAYFVAFGSTQLPLGILLDRFGARRVEAALLLFAAAGAAVFARGDSISTLAVGRGMIGLGVSACLMAAFKSFSQWFPVDKLPSLTGWIMTCGTLGGLAASTPLDAVLHVATWRDVFYGLAATTACVSLWLFVAVPEKESATRPQSLPELVGGIREVLYSRHFWRFASLAFAQVGGFMAVQSLWSGAWLIHVDGYSRSGAAERLTAMNAAMVVSYFLIGLLSTRLAKRGICTVHLLGGGMSLALLTLLMIVTQVSDHHTLMWVAYGLFSSTGTLTYAATAAAFPVALSGRVNTVLNLFAFTGAFGVQWGMGVIIDALAAAGRTPAAAHRDAFVALFAIQAASLVWFFVSGKRAAAAEAAAASTSAAEP